MVKALSEITHNTRVKTYPDGSQDILIASSPVFREKGWEQADKWEKDSRSTDRKKSFGDVPRAKRRARAAVRDLALCNDFSYFVTLTLSAERVSRYDMGEVVRKLNTWADNRVRRNGLVYVLVPELHQDGAIHFHGFFNDALRVVDSGTMIPPTGGKPRRPRSEAQRAEWAAEGGHMVYNLPDWSLGFSTAIELYGTRRAAVGYVCKYITKSLTKIGGRWYYSGGKLIRPTVELDDVEPDGVDFWGEDSFGTEGLNCRFVSLHVENSVEKG